MSFTKTTEQDSNYNHLENMNISELINNINREDHTVAQSVQESIPQIVKLTEQIVSKLKEGGRLFYIGAGTSGRLGILDASECPPTFGTDPEKVIGIIAGGDFALRNSIENAEDDTQQAWKDLETYQITSKDILIGIAASGTTPYVIGGLAKAQEHGIPTGCIACNLNSPLAAVSDYPIEVIVGPEFLTGSSRMKAGTAQKLILNSITTATMIQLGHVKGNKMVDMQLKNDKLVDRAQRFVMDELNVSLETAKDLLAKHKNIRGAINAFQNS
mgnify:CR=1 FL=1